MKRTGQALDDGSGQLGAALAPLLFGVALDQLLEYILADKRKRPCSSRLEGSAFANLLGCFLLLALNDFLRFNGSLDSPHLREGVHVERQVVQLVLVAGNGAVHIVVELGELIYVIPNGTKRRMEDMGTVLMHVDAIDFFRVDVAAM